MNLLLKEKPSHKSLPPEYRGTHRWAPCYVEKVSANHPANCAYFLFLELKSKDGLLHDLAKARQIAEAYKTLIPPENYEVIELTKGKSVPENSGAVFLGFDLSHEMGDSLIPALTLVHKRDGDRSWKKGVANEIIIFHRLVKEHFRPKLNKYILFDEYDTASFCLDCMMAILNLSPQFYEVGEYEVISVYKVGVE